MPISTFKLDHPVRFAVFLRAFKNIAVEGHLLFDHPARLGPTLDAANGRWPSDETVARHPHIRFGNIFITPEGGNSQLRVAPPANADFSGLPPLPNDENPYHLTKDAEQSGDLGLLGDGWHPLDRRPRVSTGRYAIDPDRDTNGAGLVYFANYIAFMDSAERRALVNAGTFNDSDVSDRTLQTRRVAYYGNVAVDDALHTTVALFERDDDERALGVRYAITRERDGRLICRSEAIKTLPARRV